MRLVRGIPADEITALWPRLEPLVGRALARSQDYTLDEVHQSLREERRQCFATWPEIDTICITSIEVRPARKVLVIWWKAGRLHSDWYDMLKATENWGKSLGCTRIEFRGRKGWERVLPRGYETDSIYWKDLSDG
jgi:hypothetical protein